ncbi:MAG: DUF2079 domain-containing protein [Pseudanabaena sp. M046S1SP1A06QC]|nr:DUF2079 domain-containing protein [Pseudanabaena sp. M046S1SP1A06QC]
MNSTEKLNRYSINSIFIIVVVSTLVLFFFSSLRHSLFQSGAWDLGIFDQGVYLISQGLLPLSSFTDFHILADHAAFILYPLSIFYKIYPDIHWLLLIQAVALASGAIPVYKLALQQGVSNNQGYLLCLIYVLSPLIFNANLFDFHPDVVSVPFFLWAVLLARTGKALLFFLALVMILSCKAVFSITVTAMGIWLVLFEKKKLMGLIAILVGIVWLIVATQLVIPLIGGESASTVRHIARYASLGNSYSEIFMNVFLKPNLFINKIFSIDSFVYLLLLFTPFIWFLKNTNLSPLLVVIPTIAMSILSDDPAQRYLANQYPLPVLPFLMLIAITNLRSMEFQKNWHFRFIVFWAVLAFIVMSRLNLFVGQYLTSIDTWKANNEAIAMIKTKGSILTTHEIAPHVTHRPIVNISFSRKNYNLENFDYLLLNTRYPGDSSDRNYALSLVEQAKKIPSFKLEYQKDDVYLFTKYSL